MKSTDETMIEVTAPGQTPLMRSVASCYALIERAKGPDTADLWLLNLDTKGRAQVSMHGVTVTFTVQGDKA